MAGVVSLHVWGIMGRDRVEVLEMGSGISGENRTVRMELEDETFGKPVGKGVHVRGHQSCGFAGGREGSDEAEV